MKSWQHPIQRRHARHDTDFLYGVPPNTPTEFMAQFFASMERKGLLNQCGGEGVSTERKGLLNQCGGEGVSMERKGLLNQFQVRTDTVLRRDMNAFAEEYDYGQQTSEEDPTQKYHEVDDRKLKPKPPSPPDPYENLLKEIRSRPKLRPIKGGKLLVETSRTSIAEDDVFDPPRSVKRLIKPDLNLIHDNSFEESSEDEDRTSDCSVTPTSQLSPVMTPPPMTWQRAVTKESLMSGTSGGRPNRLQRRHTIMVCESPMDGKKRWQNPVECLSLTLEEVTHIREVLTKAELESLISHPDLYQQVSKSKLCFTCKTSRFTLFGEWGTKCKLCKRTVCSKCLRKMNVPTDHFSNIPVYTLSPAPLPLETHEFIQNLIKNPPPSSVPPTRDVSPNRKQTNEVDRRKEKSDELWERPSEISVTSDYMLNKGFSSLKLKSVQRSQSVQIPSHKAAKSALKGPLMAICCDCKGMVMEIIRASRASLAMLSTSNSPAVASHSPQHMFHSPAPRSPLVNKHVRK